MIRKVPLKRFHGLESRSKILSAFHAFFQICAIQLRDFCLTTEEIALFTLNASRASDGTVQSNQG